MSHDSIEGMVVTRNESLARFYLRFLGELSCKVISSGEIAKQILMNSTNLRIVILDFSLQDKKGSIGRILKKTLANQQTYILAIAMNDLQLKAIYSLLDQRPHTNRLCIVSGFSRLWLGPIKLLRWKKKILHLSKSHSALPK